MPYPVVIQKASMITADCFRQTVSITTNASYNSGWLNLGDRPKCNFTIQVFGLDANGANTAPTNWTVDLYGTSMLLGTYVSTPFDKGSLGGSSIKQHTQADGNGTVVSTNGGPMDWVLISISDVNLGSATTLYAVVTGTN